MSSASKTTFKPYFASIKSEEVNVRIGPNIRYPIKWIFVKRNEPVEVVASFEQWKKIRDINGEDGWVNSNMLSSKRHIIVIGGKKIPLLKNCDLSSKIIAEAEQELRGLLLSCRTDLCLVEIKKIKGWIARKNLWGLYKEEELK